MYTIQNYNWGYKYILLRWECNSKNSTCLALQKKIKEKLLNRLGCKINTDVRADLKNTINSIV
jgi:hypothetical protein